MNKLWQMFAWTTIILGFFTLFLVGYWLFYPYEPLVVNEIQLLTKEVKTGDNLIYTVDYCKNTDKPSEVSRSYVDGVFYSTPTTIVNNPKGCKTNTISLLVPSLPAGTYSLRIHYHYEMNPIQNIDLNVETEQFKIIE